MTAYPLDKTRSEPAGNSDEAAAPRPASAALTKTGGYLRGFSHTLQPYIGCKFACSYCYVAGSPVHRFHQPTLAWGEYAHPRPGIDEHLRREMARLDARDQLAQLCIFMSSSTDPYQGLERTWRLARRCLDVFLTHPPGLLMLQTRSPLVEDDFSRLAALGSCAWLSLTIETDRDDVRRTVTPACPSIPRRLETARRAKAAGLQVQIAVSPCLPFSAPDTFGDLLLPLADRIVVDTPVSGDGSGGRRTAQSALPARYQDAGWGDWRAEDAAHELYTYLRQHMGLRAGWSQAGFVALTATNGHLDVTSRREKVAGKRHDYNER